MRRVVEELIAELPGGMDNPDFMRRLEARREDIFGPDSPATSG